jgi:hypothetical protein
MWCTRCGRPLEHPARSIPTKNGPLMFGRVCAIKAGLMEPRRRIRITPAESQSDQPDPAQLALELNP